jgi:hypothetical protein
MLATELENLGVDAETLAALELESSESAIGMSSF